ncbi:MAG: hypothetical protein Q7T04_04940 [Dehalococcoidia bacterium]|nr:hypothetical protein [Dehalococcoidia bacterium]
MRKTIQKENIEVKVDIHPGPVSPAQKQAWRRFWQKVIAAAKSEVTK